MCSFTWAACALQSHLSLFVALGFHCGLPRQISPSSPTIPSQTRKCDPRWEKAYCKTYCKTVVFLQPNAGCPLTSTPYKFAAPCYRLPPMALQTVQVSFEPCLSTATHKAERAFERSLNRAVVPQSLPVSATTFPRALPLYIAQGCLQKDIPQSKLFSKAKLLPFEKGKYLNLVCFPA